MLKVLKGVKFPGKTQLLKTTLTSYDKVMNGVDLKLGK